MKPEVEAFRDRTGLYRSEPGYKNGFFQIPFRSSTLRVLVYAGASDGWEHVSISLKNRNPNWEEMCFIKDLFWDEEECVLQLHVPKSQWINNHPYCLHLWRNKNATFELPPANTVG